MERCTADGLELEIRTNDRSDGMGLEPMRRGGVRGRWRPGTWRAPWREPPVLFFSAEALERSAAHWSRPCVMKRGSSGPSYPTMLSSRKE